MQESSPTSTEVERFRAALCAGLETPLSALRATLESLAGDGGESASLEGALREVLHLARGVQELGEYAAPPEPQPLRCSAIEIAYAGRYQLDRPLRDRVWVANDGADSLTVDGPLVSRALARILEHVLAAGSERALMRARNDAGSVAFAIVGDGAAIDPGAAMLPFAQTGEHDLGLGLFLARRDLELLGGSLELSRTPLGDTCAIARIPRRTPTG